ncbi:MAG: MoaD/ThiS family protein [Alphaproteobacteria bacterium]|nr:MoaD/ThiS family protein [Alphaproteobacteria bacterium]
MKLKLELFGAHSEKLPRDEGEPEFPDEIVPGEIVDWLELKDGDQFVILINGHPVSLEDRYKVKLTEGDLITVFPPMEGG